MKEPSANRIHMRLSRWYYANRARRGTVASDRDIDDQEKFFYSQPGVQTNQLERLRSLLTHAGCHVPYYRNLFRDCGFDHRHITTCNLLEQLPTLSKADIRAAGDQLLSEAVPAHERHRNASGGSTGAPLHFFQDSRYEAAAHIAAPLFDMWTGWRRGEPVALLWGAPTDIARYGLFRERVRHVLQNRFLVDAFSLDDAKLQQAVDKIRRRRPVLVVAYASAAYLLARFMSERAIVLEHPPRALISSAEVLSPHCRSLIESQMGCRVFNRYGSREVGFVAMECMSGSLHVNAVDVIVEVDRPDADGVGELLITQLNNFVFPFIRYRIGDLGAIDNHVCGCGRRLPSLTRLQGRSTDFIRTPEGRLIHGEWFTHLFYDVKGVALFTFRQVGRAHYVFEVQHGSDFDRATFSNAMQKARLRLGDAASVEIKSVDRFEATPSGKHRFVVNEYSPSTHGGDR